MHRLIDQREKGSLRRQLSYLILTKSQHPELLKNSSHISYFPPTKYTDAVITDHVYLLFDTAMR
ncbi:hypothetical protein ASD53_02380 [Lysobacter sp. Root559]|nr:hypothetical protein ASD53_02380 [Lysobacter sp. Root559]